MSLLLLLWGAAVTCSLAIAGAYLVLHYGPGTVGAGWLGALGFTMFLFSSFPLFAAAMLYFENA